MPSGTNCVSSSNESGLWQRESDIKICFLMGKAYRDSATFGWGKHPIGIAKFASIFLLELL